MGCSFNENFYPQEIKTQELNQSVIYWELLTRKGGPWFLTLMADVKYESNLLSRQDQFVTEKFEHVHF